MPGFTGTVVVDFTIASDGGGTDPPDPIPPPDTDNQIRLTNRSGAALENWPLQFGRAFVPGEITRNLVATLDGVAIPVQMDVKNRYGDGSVAFAVIAVVIPSLPPDREMVLALTDTPVAGTGNQARTVTELLDPAWGFGVVLHVTGNDGHEQTIDFGAQLEAGHCRAWTEGPIAQTMLIEDDSAARALDIGFGDGFRPLRLRAQATFWATGQVAVRVTGESGLTTEIEDLAYRFEITDGKPNSQTVYYSGDLSGTQSKPKLHWAMTRWTRQFWIGGTPDHRVDIDWNLGHLAATLWLPNYDTAIVLPESTIAQHYAYWTDRPHDIYDGAWTGGIWQNGMSTSGERQEIGPYPTWDVMALLSGDWRLRERNLGMADLAGAFPGHLRETDPNRRLCRGDPAGTGFGRCVSITDRQTLVTQRGQLTYGYTKPEHRVQIVGPYNVNQPWSMDGAHQPQPWFVAYLLTGDSFYLDSAYLWAGNAAARYNGAAPTAAYGRGPTGAEGVINDEVRGGGWVLRSRVETALMAPDADPEKRYFTMLTNDALARWEGGLGITGTVFDGDPSKAWGIKYGHYYSSNNGPNTGKPPLTGVWDSTGDPRNPSSTILSCEAQGIFIEGQVGSFNSNWMMFYTLYALGRAKELGFAVGPHLSHVARWLVGMVNSSGHPMLVAQYQSPVEMKGGGFYDWPGIVAALEPSWLTGEDWVPPQPGNTSLPQYFAQNNTADGRQAWAVPGASYMLAEPGGEEMWAWLDANCISAFASSAKPYTAEPKWAIRPRTAVLRAGVKRLRTHATGGR